MIYLLEIQPFDPAAGEVITLRFAGAPYVTEPDDDPSNVSFEARISDPGNYERSLFGRGRTRGQADIGAGEVRLVNADGELDYLLDLAFDGRNLTLYTLDSALAPWSSREVILNGTMQQAEFEPRHVSLTIRDRLTIIDEPILTETYLGTTVSGGRDDAEGNTDLKDTKKPGLFGTALAITPIMVDQFDHVYQVAWNRLSRIWDVRERGVKLTATQDYPDLASLKAATLTSGQYATCLALGLLITAERPDGTLTCNASEGATVADRSAARIAQRMLADLANVAASDFDDLHTANPAECGIWIEPGETTILEAASTILNSVSASLWVDRLGSFRAHRLQAPVGDGLIVDDSVILDDGSTLAREATSDEGNGVQAKSVTIRYAEAYTTFREDDLRDTASDDAFRSFAVQQWRQVKVESEANKTVHPLGPDLVLDTAIVNEEDARAEAERLLAIYGVRRDLFRIRAASEVFAGLDLADTVTLAPSRYGLASGKPFVVLSAVPTYARNTTELEVWG